jgi:8-oxo-dGTP pyrophosphatase MutT (NUDIX family)/S1-C subfamily serine protease
VPGWLARVAEAAAAMPVPAPLRPPRSGGRPAAVLILFGTGPSGPDLLLIERAAELRKHPGQPAFPGGAIDDSDGGPVQAALREAAEETGVDPAGVRVLTQLPELYIARSDFRVTPVLGWWHSPVPVGPGDPAEIAAVIRVPVADLATSARPSASLACSSGVSPRSCWTGCSRSAAGSGSGMPANQVSCCRCHQAPSAARALYLKGVSVDLLDLILLVMIAAFAVAGYRQGFIVGVLSLAGFIGGVAAGALIAPPISHALSSSQTWQSLIAVLVVFIAAVIGMLAASAIGVVVRSRVTARPAAIVDSLGGAAVNVVALLIVAWLIGSFVYNAPFPAISSQVNRSLVLRAVDRIMPSGALDLPIFPPLRTLLSNGVYEQIFSTIGAETAPDIPAPGRAVLASSGLNAAYQSIVKVKGVAPSCNDTIEGSGFVISTDHVLTNAHVVAGVTRGLHVITGAGQWYTRVTVVWYDPNIDAAVLYVPGLTASPLQFAGPATDGAPAVVAGYPLDQGLTERPAVIGHSFEANGPNIYDTQNVNRQIYPIRADVEPGNSGGPLLSGSGTVYGVVFAKSTQYQGVGYALTAAQVSHDVQKGRYKVTRTSTGQCQSS